MKEIIKKKITYWKGMETKMVREFIRINQRVHRDSVVKIQERLQTYEELIDLIKE